MKFLPLFAILTLLSAHAFAACTGTITSCPAATSMTDADVVECRQSGDTADKKCSALVVSKYIAGKAVNGGYLYNSAGTLTGPVAGGKGMLVTPPYVSGNYYLMSPLGSGFTANSTTPLVNDTEYAAINFALAPVSIHSIGFQTSSTNASVGGSIKVCIYAADGANSAPYTLLGQTTTGIAITDAIKTTNFNLVLDSDTTVPQGLFWIATLQTSTTGVRLSQSTGSISTGILVGASTESQLFSGTGVLGYSMSQTYSSGCASPFSASPTVISNISFISGFAVEIH